MAVVSGRSQVTRVVAAKSMVAVVLRGVSKIP